LQIEISSETPIFITPQTPKEMFMIGKAASAMERCEGISSNLFSLILAEWHNRQVAQLKS
jgi:hypothetical protein